jgi:hypothetical protein
MSVLKHIKAINRSAALTALASSLFATGAEASISLGSSSSGGSENTLGTYGPLTLSGSNALGDESLYMAARNTGTPTAGNTKATKATIDGGMFGESTLLIATEGTIDSDPLPIKNKMSSITLESGALNTESLKTSTTTSIGGQIIDDGENSGMKVYTSKGDDTGTTINISNGDLLKDYSWATQ